MKQKGNGVSGGGLKARINDWENIKGVPAGKFSILVGGMLYHKPGSQNPRKGGRK